MLKENKIQKQIIDGLKLLGIVVFRRNAGQFQAPSGYWLKAGNKGDPDILACHKGRFIAIEVKRSEEDIKRWFKNSKKIGSYEYKQKECLEQIDNAGGISIITHSLDDVIKILKINNEKDNFHRDNTN